MISSTPFQAASRLIVKLALIVVLTAGLSSLNVESNAAPSNTVTATRTAAKSGAAKTSAVKPALFIKSGATGKKSTIRPVSHISASSGRPRVLEFSAVWCGPCKIFEPTFKKVSGNYASKASFESYDIDDVSKGQKLANKYGIEAVPSVIILDSQGKVVFSHAGLMDEQSFTQEITRVVGR